MDRQEFRTRTNFIKTRCMLCKAAFAGAGHVFFADFLSLQTQLLGTSKSMLGAPAMYRLQRQETAVNSVCWSASSFVVPDRGE